MKKRMVIMLIGAAILFGGIALYKIIVGMMIARFMAANQPIATVSTMKVAYSTWQPNLYASGSTRAIYGVNVTTKQAGMVTSIDFTPGMDVQKGDVLVELDNEVEKADLTALKARAELARITYERDKQQFAIKAISKQVLDSDLQNLRNLEAQVEAQAATLGHKTIIAPFTGRLGINLVNPGQFINPGDAVVTLQTLDPIYVDFFIPQQNLSQLALDAPVVVTTDAYPKKTFSGKITTINPLVDPDTRNVEVEATITNSSHEIYPGMYVKIEINTGKPEQLLTLPQSAISFNPYGALVFRVYDQGKDKAGKPNLIVRQTFVVTGDTRGEQVAILKGLKPGDEVVTSGQLKLKNGSRIAINNTVQPSDNPDPSLPNEH